jgi:putative tryptophan/tyrosine transport system substrate-binding protein
VRRREFITLVGGAAAWPLATRAQQRERMRLIGMLLPFAENDEKTRGDLDLFREQLRPRGWTEHQNVEITIRWAAGDVGRIQTLAKELVALKPDVILGRSTPVTKAILHESTAIPIVSGSQ